MKVVIMKALICTSLIVASISMLQAGDLMGDGALKVLMNTQKPHSEQGPNDSFKRDNPFSHAEEGKKGLNDSLVMIEKEKLLIQDDLAENKASDILNDAQDKNPVKEELAKQEALEDQKFGVMTGQDPNGDESKMLNDLDLKIPGFNKHAAGMFNQAQVAAGG